MMNDETRYKLRQEIVNLLTLNLDGLRANEVFNKLTIMKRNGTFVSVKQLSMPVVRHLLVELRNVGLIKLDNHRGKWKLV